MDRFLAHSIRLIAIFASLYVLASCTGSSQDATLTSDDEVNADATLVPLANATPTHIPTGEPTTIPTLTLSIWWPDTLYPADAELLDNQIRDFVSSQGVEIDVDFRRKRTQDVGGILSTLRSAARVAPGALPDVVLLRRTDLVNAYQDNLIFPMDGLVPAVVIGDIYDSALRLGQLDEQIYGLPYLIDVIHLTYPIELGLDFPDGNVTFDTLLGNNTALLFPAAQVSGVSDMFYAQYLSAGGTPPTPEATFVPDREALTDTLSFYEQARERGVINETLLELNRISDYQVELATGAFSTALIDSTTYLTLKADGAVLQAASIPTRAGETVGIIGGWMWVVTTSDADHQAVVSDFIAWMMDPTRQSALANTLHMLPSQQSVVQTIDGDIDEILLLNDILENAYLPLTDTTGGIYARAMQNALISVISGEQSAAEAAAVVLERASN